MNEEGATAPVSVPWPQRVLDRTARVVHAMHGTRSLLLAITLLLLLGVVEPFLPSGAWRAIYTTPVLVIAVVGLMTLPREAVAVQARVRQGVRQEDGRRLLVRGLGYPALLLFFLIPRLFLGAYGIPHMSPLTGFVSPGIQQWISATFLFLLLLIPILQIRRTRHYAPEVRVNRPRDLPAHAFEHRQRDLLQGLLAAIVLVWLVALAPFWGPFSLLQWPPTLSSLTAGTRAVASLVYAVFLPSILFVNASAHAQALRDLWQDPETRQDWQDLAVLATHVLASLLAILLHAYAMLWIAKYASAVGF